MEKDHNQSVYEASYIFLPSISDEQIPGKTEALKESIVSLGGQVISHENPVLIDLSYSMTKVVGTTRHKVQSGYFGWVKFEIENENIGAVKKSFDANDEILRYLIVKTVRENTLLNGKMMFKKEEKVKKEEDEVEGNLPEVLKEPVSEDLDKSIDDLVIA